jgi:hypothetical protein
MKPNGGYCIVLAIALATSLGACREYPTKPAGWLSNRNPLISSAAVFPQVIGQGDSVIVTASAFDPDGDTLRYDWVTDSRLHLTGDVLGEGDVNNTESNSIVAYRTKVSPINDTAWVDCEVRDGKGGGAFTGVHILLKN